MTSWSCIAAGLWNGPELDHITNKRHAGQVKAFLSQSTDMFRVPYGKATEAFPRRGIIVG